MSSFSSALQLWLPEQILLRTQPHFQGGKPISTYRQIVLWANAECAGEIHIPEIRGDLSFKFSEKREGIKCLYQLSASLSAAFFLRTHLYCRRIIESQSFLGWKRPIRSSSPALNPVESINSLINRFELANISLYDYAAAVLERRIRIQNMKYS